MIFITLGKFRKKPTKETVATTDKLIQQVQKQGVKIVGAYWTLGRYDAVAVWEAPDSETAMKAALSASDYVASETLVALKREDAVKLLD